MEPPKCPVCGVKEWSHLCSGKAASEIERRAAAVRPLSLRELVYREMQAAVTKPVTKVGRPVTKVKRKAKMGRPLLGEKPTTSAERMRRYRAKAKHAHD